MKEALESQRLKAFLDQGISLISFPMLNGEKIQEGEAQVFYDVKSSEPKVLVKKIEQGKERSSWYNYETAQFEDETFYAVVGDDEDLIGELATAKPLHQEFAKAVRINELLDQIGQDEEPNLELLAELRDLEKEILAPELEERFLNYLLDDEELRTVKNSFKKTPKQSLRILKKIEKNFLFNPVIDFVELYDEGSLSLVVEEKGFEIILDKSYCVLPNCRCTEVHMDIFINDGFLVEFAYDYVSGGIRIEDDVEDVEEMEEFVANLVSSFPGGVISEFTSDHKRVRLDTGLFYTLKNRSELKAFMKELSTSEKPSRNSPCVCGSGKKYKHCCLRK